ADFLHKQGRDEEAIEHVRAAMAIRPHNLGDNLNLGFFEHSLGNLAAAIEQYQVVAVNAAEPGLRAKAYSDMGIAYREMGQLTGEKQCFEASLRLVPNQPTL